MSLPKKVHLLEVSPRDGLQNESTFVASDVKIAFINRLSNTGLQAIEVTSFVSHTQIPQLSDHKKIFRDIDKKQGIDYSALIPNITGLKSAMEEGVSSIALFSAASDTFCQKNIHCSIEESLERFSKVIKIAQQHKVRIRAYVSCAFYCPDEGYIDADKVTALAFQLYQMGCHELCLASTMGKATVQTIDTLLTSITKKIPPEHIALHFHDTYGQALTNVYASLQGGIHRFDCSVAGLGGCPQAKGTGGNLSSEDLVYFLEGLGIPTGIDLPKLVEAGHFICDYLKRPNESKVGQAYKDLK